MANFNDKPMANVTPKAATPKVIPHPIPTSVKNAGAIGGKAVPKGDNG